MPADVYTPAARGVPLSGDRRPDRRRQDATGRTAGDAASTARRCSRTPTTRFSPTSTTSAPGAALQAQLFYLLNRHRQLTALRQADLFQHTIGLRLPVRSSDKIFAYLNLDDNELFIYQRLYDLLARDIPAPDLVVYLQAPTDVLLRRLRGRSRSIPSAQLPQPDADLPARAERGLPALLLPLHRHAAPGRRDLAVRSRNRRRSARRSGAADQRAWARGRATTCRATSEA